jgi:hypothetical protein
VIRVRGGIHYKDFETTGQKNHYRKGCENLLLYKFFPLIYTMTLLSSPPLCIFLQFFLDALLEVDALFFSWEFCYNGIAS